MSSTADFPDWLEQLRAALDDPEQLQSLARTPDRTPPGRGSAVLILLGEGDGGPELLYVERAATLRHHPAQIAFPGGAVENGDADLAATALREAWEETGLDPRGVQIIGELPSVSVAVSGFEVTPVLGWWRDRSPVAPGDPGEVAAVHLVSIGELTDPARRARVRHPSGYVGPAFEVAGVLIWGLTGHFTDALLRLGGWQQPWDTDRLVPIPAQQLR